MLFQPMRSRFQSQIDHRNKITSLDVSSAFPSFQAVPPESWGMSPTVTNVQIMFIDVAIIVCLFDISLRPYAVQQRHAPCLTFFKSAGPAVLVWK